jgi:hypothetical protein
VPSRAVLVVWGDGDLLGNGPYESCQLTHNGDGDHVGMFASCHEPSGALTQPDLGLPTTVLKNLRWFFEPQLQMSADLGGRAVRPGAFHQRLSGMGGYQLW